MLYVSVINTFEDFCLVFDLVKLGVFLKNSSPIFYKEFLEVFGSLFYNLEVYFMENNLRDVNDDLMKEWFQFREESKFCYLT